MNDKEFIAELFDWNFKNVNLESNWKASVVKPDE